MPDAGAAVVGFKPFLFVHATSEDSFPQQLARQDRRQL